MSNQIKTIEFHESSMISDLRQFVIDFSEITDQGDLNAMEICFPESLVNLCEHFGIKPWLLVASYRREEALRIELETGRFPYVQAKKKRKNKRKAKR